MPRDVGGGYRAEPYGRGLQVVRAATDPAAGAEVSVLVPGWVCWELVSLDLSLVTDATIQNRRLRLLVDDQTDVVYRWVSQAVQAENLTRRYHFAAGLGFEQAAFVVETLLVGLPALELGPGFRIRTSTDLLAGTDNYARPTLYVREYSAIERAEEREAEQRAYREAVGAAGGEREGVRWPT